MNKICPIALIVLSLAVVASALSDSSTKQQTLAYSCGYLAGIQYRLTPKKEELDYCKAIRLTAVKDGFTSAANP